MAEGQLERLNADLDDKLVAYFDLYTEYQTLFADLTNRLKNGWWELGRARYAMGAGVNTLSQRQYPAFMTATAHYRPNGAADPTDKETEKTGMEETSAKDGSSLHRRTTGKAMTDGKASGAAGEKAEGTQRAHGRKSHGDVDDKPSDNISEEQPTEAKSEKDRERWKGPLHWFGLLTPPTLRTAQTEFKSAVEVVCALTTVKRQLHVLQEEYQGLMEKKRQLTEHSS